MPDKPATAPTPDKPDTSPAPTPDKPPAPAPDKPAASTPVTSSPADRSDPTGTSTQARQGPAATAPAGEELSGDDLLAAAQIKAPHVDRAFLSEHGLDDDYLRALASGEEPPPPYNGPDTSATDLHLTPGGWQVTPPGVPPEHVGKDQVRR